MSLKKKLNKMAENMRSPKSRMMDKVNNFENLRTIKTIDRLNK
jgi:predicted transcriptional regulator